jgi:hypothetical protein
MKMGYGKRDAYEEVLNKKIKPLIKFIESREILTFD